MAGLEVLRSLNDLKIETNAPIEVVVWTNEEGSRFPPCMMGSGVYIGRFDLAETLARTDEDGVSVGEALNAIGYAGDAPLGGRPLAAYFEAHIEQGPVLEAEKKTVGVVLGALGQKWFDVTLTGVEAHAGPTPMARRQDALLGTAEVIAAVNKTAVEHQPHGCGTVGWVQVSPNSRNVIPGQVRFSIDLRHLDPAVLDEMVSDVTAAVQAAAQKNGLEAEMVPTADFPPLSFAPHLVDQVRQGAIAHGLSHMDIVSGAGHDAIFLAEQAPAAMIFVPCENGISHNEIENADPKDLEAGCNVLLSAMLSVAGIAPSEAAQ
jgi:N-carbamoyl-L-amino-acid hydrolase